MDTFLKYAAFYLISWFTEQALDKEKVKRVRNYIIELAGDAIDTTVKHERAAFLIKDLAGELSDGVVDWVIKTILWVARATGQIAPGSEVKRPEVKA